jgi:hypothetical protein
MKRVMALLLLAGLAGCGGIPIDGTDPLNVVVPCNTAYYNSQFGFGFDLPSTAVLESQGSDPPLFAFDADWSVAYSDANVSFLVFVQGPIGFASTDPAAMLAEWADVIRGELQADHSIIADNGVTLPNGDAGHLFITVRTDIPVSSYYAFTVKDSVVFTLFATTVQPVSLPVDFFIIDTVFSLCVD